MTHAAPESFLTRQEIVAAARRNLAPGPWAYLAGATETETTLRRNRQALDSIAFRPRVLEEEGGPLIWPRITEGEQESFDATCRQLYKYLSPANNATR